MRPEINVIQTLELLSEVPIHTDVLKQIIKQSVRSTQRLSWKTTLPCTGCDAHDILAYWLWISRWWMNSSVIGKGTHYLDVEMLGRVLKAGGTSCSDVIVQIMTYYLLSYYRWLLTWWLYSFYSLFFILD